MRMIQQTPEQLVLLHRPIMLSIGLVFLCLCLLAAGMWNITDGAWGKAGIAFLAAAALAAPAIWFAMERIDVEFDSTRGTCTVQTRHLSGSSQELYRLDQVEEATLQSHKGPGYGAGAHRIALVLAPGRPEDIRPLISGYGGERGVKDLAQRINSWLKTARASKDT
ncbi:MAG: hypothetical protein ABJQ70_14380 [Roseobacter sp.]